MLVSSEETVVLSCRQVKTQLRSQGQSRHALRARELCWSSLLSLLEGGGLWKRSWFKRQGTKINRRVNETNALCSTLNLQCCCPCTTPFQLLPALLHCQVACMMQKLVKFIDRHPTQCIWPKRVTEEINFSYLWLIHTHPRHCFVLPIQCKTTNQISVPASCEW